MANDDVTATLSGLIGTCRDAECGFRAAAEAVGDAALQRLFGVYAQQRAQFRRELQSELTRLGGTPPGHGSVAGALHRALINLRAAVSDERTIIAEAERGEDAAIAAYAEALQVASLPVDVRALILRQAARVKETHQRLSDLKRAA